MKATISFAHHFGSLDRLLDLEPHFRRVTMLYVYRLFPEKKALDILQQLESLEWSQGRARTQALTGTVKRNLEIKDLNNPINVDLSTLIGAAILQHADIGRAHLPKKLSGVRFNNYSGHGTYHRHTDSVRIEDVRTDLACTIFLTDPDSYEGGDLEIENIDGAVLKHKGRPGECVIYECGKPHRVTPVTRGSRISGITWIQSRVRDEKRRQLLKKTLQMSLEMEKEMNLSDPDDKFRKWIVDCGYLHAELMRQWMD